MPVYPEYEKLTPEAPVNAIGIQKFQNMHQGEAAQQDQEDNKQGNEGEFNQPQEQHQTQPMQGQQAS